MCVTSLIYTSAIKQRGVGLIWLDPIKLEAWENLFEKKEKNGKEDLRGGRTEGPLISLM